MLAAKHSNYEFVKYVLDHLDPEEYFCKSDKEFKAILRIGEMNMYASY